MLKVKFWRMRNVVLMEIVEQDIPDSRRGAFTYKASNGVNIVSWESPNLYPNELQIRGNNKLMDFNLASFQFDNSEDAKIQLSKYQEAITEYNSITIK